MTDHLFDDDPVRPPAYPAWFTAGITAPVTHIRNVAAGPHPLGLRLLKPNTGETCGSCAHQCEWSTGPHSFKKCVLMKNTHGPATDIRDKWAACVKWEARQ